MIITISRKPFKGSLIESVKSTQCGGLNIDSSRIGVEKRTSTIKDLTSIKGNNFGNGSYLAPIGTKSVVGRWPANLILSHGSPTTKIDEQSGISLSSGGRIGNAKGVFHYQGGAGWSGVHEKGESGFGDVGGASRYFKKVSE